MAEPVISLSEVIKDDAAAVATASRQHDGWGGVGFAGHPGRVEGVCDQEEGHDQDHPTGHLVEGTKIRHRGKNTVLMAQGRPLRTALAQLLPLYAPLAGVRIRTHSQTLQLGVWVWQQHRTVSHLRVIGRTTSFLMGYVESCCFLLFLSSRLTSKFFM